MTEGYIASDSITNWTATRVGVWLMNTCELGQYCEMFYTSRINGAVLKDLTDEELEELGIHNRMHRKRILTEIMKQNQFEMNETGSSPSSRYWTNSSNSLYAPSPRARKNPHDFSFSPRDSPKFTLGPGGTPRAWVPPKKDNSKPGDVLARSPKASPYKTVASVNLIEALDTVEAEQKRRHAKWYANKVVEKSLVAMREALVTPRGIAVLKAEARYHGSIEAARETLMHNTRIQALNTAIEDFYSGNWRHKGVSPMNKYAHKGFKIEEQLEAAMKEEEDQRRRMLLGQAQKNVDLDDEVVRTPQRRHTGDDDDLDAKVSLDPEETAEQRITLIREKYAAPERPARYSSPGPGVNLESEARSPGQLLVDTLMRDAEEEDEEDRRLFERAATKGLQLKQLILTKKSMLEDARQRGDIEAARKLEAELVPPTDFCSNFLHRFHFFVMNHCVDGAFRVCIF